MAIIDGPKAGDHGARSGLEYRLIRARRKTVGIIVEADGAVIVRAPVWVSRAQIHEIVEGRSAWIRAKIAEMRQRPRRPPPTYECGETLLYLGREYPLHLTESAISGIRFHGAFFIARANQPSAPALLREWYRSRAEAEIASRIVPWAAALGVMPSRVGLSDARGRWGSCSPRGHLRFNWRIIMAPPEVIDYLLLHELAHLREHNHSPRFWRVVAERMPDYRTAKEWLHEHSHLLEGL